MNASFTKRRRAALFMATVGLVAGVARGDEHLWIGPDGSWNTSAYWDPYGVPTSLGVYKDSAVIPSPFLTAPASRTVYYDGAGYNLSSVSLGPDSDHTGTVNHWGSYTLNTDDLLVGAGGYGYYNQAAGNVNVQSDLWLGRGIYGEYNLSGGCLIAGAVSVGTHELGKFTQTGGSATLDSLSVRNGKYILTGALTTVMNVGSEDYPREVVDEEVISEGTMQQQGGDHTAGSIVVASSYELKEGKLTVTGNLTVANEYDPPNSAFMCIGEHIPIVYSPVALTVGGTFHIGREGGLCGSVMMTSGTATVTTEMIVHSGSLFTYDAPGSPTTPTTVDFATLMVDTEAEVSLSGPVSGVNNPMVIGVIPENWGYIDFKGGTLNGGGPGSVHHHFGTFEWGAGTIGTMAMEIGSDREGGRLYMRGNNKTLNNSTITNRIYGTMDFEGCTVSGSQSTITNQGTMNCTGNTTLGSGITFVNDGGVINGPLTINGPFTIKQTLTWTTAQPLTISGQQHHDSDSNAELIMAAGTLTMNTDAGHGGMNLAIDVRAGATANFNATQYLRTLTNAGTINAWEVDVEDMSQTGGSGTFDDIWVSYFDWSGGSLTFRTGMGLWIAQEFNILCNTTLSSGFLVNWGTIRKSGPAGGTTHIGVGTEMLGATVIDVAQGMALIFDGVLSHGASQTITKTGDGSVTFNGAQYHDSNSTFSVDEGTAYFNTDARGTGMGRTLTLNVNSGTTVSFGATQHLKRLAITSGQATLTQGNAKYIDTEEFSVSGTGGKLDLKDNDMIVRATSGTRTAVFQDIWGHVQAARNTSPNLWQGDGITTSMAGASEDETSLGVILNQKLDGTAVRTTFNGETVDINCILVKYTWNGDANLDGVVNGDDYFQIDQGYLYQRTGWHWGDFNYDGVVNIDDYILIDHGYLAQTGPLSGGSVCDMAAVPEPGVLGLLGCCGVLMMRRRRER